MGDSDCEPVDHNAWKGVLKRNAKSDKGKGNRKGSDIGSKTNSYGSVKGVEFMTIDDIILNENDTNERKRGRHGDSDGSDASEVEIRVKNLKFNENNGGKLKNVSSKDTSGPSSQNASIESKMDKIAPVIIFKVEEDMKDRMKLENYLKSNVKDVNIEDVKITANGNVLIYTNNKSENDKIMKNENLFKDKKKLDLSLVDKKPYLIIKNITFDYAEQNFDELNDNYGIVDIIEMKNKMSNKSFQFVKIEIENEVRKSKLLEQKFIKLGYSRFYLEEFSRPPIQCRKCKGYNHIEKFCKNELKCSKCSGNHDVNVCTSEKPKCANCEGDHSSFYRGCQEYLKEKNKKLEKTNVATKTNPSSSGFIRNYSSFVHPTESVDDKISSFGNKLVEDLNKSIKAELSKSMNNINETLKEMNKTIKVNNMKICYLMIETMKICFPNLKMTQDKMNDIKECFNFHQLGNLDINNLTNYFCKEKSNKNVSAFNTESANEYIPNNKHE
jgi:hypothetical protein